MSGIKLIQHRMLSGGSASGETRCYEYQVWDALGRLVYVGIADNFLRRWAQHLRQSWWIGEIAVDRVEVTGWPDRQTARWSEACVINEQSPVYNTALESASYRHAHDPESTWLAPVERFIYVETVVAA